MLLPILVYTSTGGSAIIWPTSCCDVVVVMHCGCDAHQERMGDYIIAVHNTRLVSEQQVCTYALCTVFFATRRLSPDLATLPASSSFNVCSESLVSSLCSAMEEADHHGCAVVLIVTQCRMV
jgi:hypothetical protein